MTEAAEGPRWATMPPSLQLLASYAMGEVLVRTREQPGTVPFALHRKTADAVPIRRDFEAATFEAGFEQYCNWAQTSDEATGEFAFAYEQAPTRHRTIALHVEASGATPAYSILQFFEWSRSGPVVVGEPHVGWCRNDAPYPRLDDQARERLAQLAPGAEVVCLADAQYEPGCVAVIGASVIWQSKKTRRLYRTGIDGGLIEPVTERIMQLSSLVAVGEVLIGAGYSSVLRIDPRSGQVTTIAEWGDDDESGSNLRAIVDGNFIYANDGWRLLRIPLAGGQRRVISREGAAIESLALHRGELVFVRHETEVCAVPVTGGASRVIAEAPSARDVASDGDSLYWTELDTCKVRRLTPEGAIVTVHEGELEPTRIVAAGGVVVWCAGTWGHQIMRAHIATGRVEFVAMDVGHTVHLALSSGYVVCSVQERRGELGKVIRLA